MTTDEVLRKIVQAISRQQFPCPIGAGPYDFWKEFEGIDRDTIRDLIMVAIHRGYLDGRPRVAGPATFLEPRRFAEGIEYVIVNGTPVIESGRPLDARPGQILYGPGKPNS